MITHPLSPEALICYFKEELLIFALSEKTVIQVATATALHAVMVLEITKHSKSSVCANLLAMM